MELECVKYKEKMDSEGARCRHPEDYCKDRTSCIINFMSLEKSQRDKGSKAEVKSPQASDEEESR